MADHTLTHSFHSRPRSLSSPSQPQGVQIEVGNGNEYQQFQDTLPVDDTMVLDSPVVETRLEKLDFDTQVVDDFESLEDGKLRSIFEYEKEVVLDSEDEDEDVCRNKMVRIPNRLLDANTLNLQNRAAACADQQRSPGNKGCAVKVDRSDKQDDVPQLFTCNNGSEESEKSSQANALEFVDQFLSFNKMEFSSGSDIKKIARKKSPPVSSAKGPQILAKKMKFRAATITKIGTFEWADTDQPIKPDVFSKRMKNRFELEGFRQRSVMRHQKSRHLNTKGDMRSAEDRKKKKEIFNLHKAIMGSNHSDSRFVEHTPKESCRMEEVSKLTAENSGKEFNEDMHAESSEDELDASDIFDVGFNTQIAAEAMEALSHGPSTGCSAFDAYQGPSNITENSLKSITRKANSEHTSFPKSDCCDLGCTGRKSTPRKRNARKSCKKSSNQELDPELAMTKKLKKHKSLIGEQFNCRHAASTESSGRRCKRMVPREENGNVGGKNEGENYLGPAISVERISLSKEGAERELKSSSAVGQETRQSLAGDTLQGTNVELDNPAERTDDGILKYRRKRSRLVADSTKVESARERSSDSPAEAGDSKLSQKEQTNLTGCLKLDAWSHPKGKRALRKVQSRAKANNIFAPFTTVNGNKGESLYIRSQKTTEDCDETTCYNADTEALFPGECHRIKTFMQSCKVNDMDCVLFSNGVEKNHKFRVSPDQNLELSVSGYPTSNSTKRINAASSNYVSSNYHKRPFNKNLPKSSLLKELINLGVPESIPDFTWKDLRRRREMAYVRVLFSQHLDDNIIKQQKKISARLGISIATCSMDATHFIADKFVRTRNMLEAIALGKPVVTHLWLESCGQASCLIDEKNYILRDAKKEKEIGFSMPVSVARASQHPLLEGYSVFITPNIKPPKEMITSLVKAVHGQVVEASQMSAAKVQDNLLILSCEEDHPICVPLLEKGIAAYSSELLLSGIVIQKLQFQRHKLFNNHAKRNQTST